MLHIWFTSREECICTLSEEKQNAHIFIQVYKRSKSGKVENIKKRGCREPFQISIMGRVCIIGVWYGSKYTPEVMQDSKIYLKLINTKILEKTVHLFNVDLAEDIPT